MHKQDSLSRAKRQVEAMKGFYIHLAVFVPVIALLFVINAVAKTPEWWVQWPFFGWGAGILGHAFAVFSHSPGLFARWEQRKIETLKSKLDAAETPVGEVPKPLVAATAEIVPIDRTAR